VKAERLVVALGGNAIARSARAVFERGDRVERGADPESQQRALEQACEQIAEL